MTTTFKRYFISGHLDLSPSKFAEKYETQIRDAAAEDGGCASFVVGDARGTDTFAQDLLNELGVERDRVLVYHIGEQPRNNKHNWPTRGGFRSDSQRDAAMTEDSTHDILYFRTEEEARELYGVHYKKRVSGTEKNANRRLAKSKK